MAGLAAFTILHQLVLYPFFLSPLRGLPGPPLGPNLLIGEEYIRSRTTPVIHLSELLYHIGRFGDILNGEAGIPQREWIKKYGKVVRVVGPIGLQRVIFAGNEALQKILVTSWISNPRVRTYMAHFIL